VPPARWITRITCSPFAAGTAWLSLNRYRQNDFAPYLFRTDDFGKTWKSIAGNLPADGPIHVVRADGRNPDLLYVGTEFGLFVSLDAGTSWQPLGAGLPPVAVHDLIVHPRDRELVVATHGRGLYIIDVAPLQDMTEKVRAAKVYLFDPRPVRLAQRGTIEPPLPRTFVGANPPQGAVIYYRLAEKQPAVSLQVTSLDGTLLANLPPPTRPGLHVVKWQSEKIAPGEYMIRLAAAGQSIVRKLRVERERVDVAE
jgi:hypothetical protein